MDTVNVRLMETKYGDRYIVVDSFFGTDGKWHQGSYETVPKRYDVPADKIATDKTIWSADIPVAVWMAAHYHKMTK